MKFKNYFVFLIIFLAAVILLSYDLNKPFIGHHDFNSVFFSHIARNLLRYPINQSKLGMVVNAGPPFINQKLGYYTNHPPLLPILMALSFRLFGFQHFAARLVPVIFSTLSAIFIYLIAKLKTNQITALFASLFFLATPMIRYFSRMPNHEPLTLFFVLATLYSFLNWLNKRKSRDFILTNLFIIIGGFSGWTIHFLLPLLVISTFFLKKPRPWTSLAFLFSSFLSFSLVILHLTWLTNSSTQQLINAFFFRLGVGDQSQKISFNLLQFLNQEVHWFVALYTLTLTLLASAGLLFTRKPFLFLLLLFGLAHPLIFRNQAFIHDYLLFYLAPFLAISAALFLDKVTSCLKAAISSFFHLGGGNQITPRKSSSTLQAFHLRGGILKTPRELLTPIAQVIKLLIFLSTLVLIINERKALYQALVKTEMNRPGMELGLYLNQISQPQDKIFVQNQAFGNLYSYFVQYYADRQINYGLELPKNIKDYHFLVTFKNGQFQAQPIHD